MSQTKPVPAWWQSTHFPIVLFFFCFFVISLLFRFISFSVRSHTDSPLPTPWQLADFLRFQPSFKLTSLLLNIPSPTTPLGSSSKLTGYLRVSKFLRKSFSKYLSTSPSHPPTEHLRQTDCCWPSSPNRADVSAREGTTGKLKHFALCCLLHSYVRQCCSLFLHLLERKKICCIFKLENIPLV